MHTGMQAKLCAGQVQGKQALVCAGRPHPMASTHSRHEHTGISSHHTPPVPAGDKGISAGEQARIQAMQGIPIEVAAGLGKGAVRDTAHMSESTQRSPINITGQACKEAIESALNNSQAVDLVRSSLD